MNRVKLVAFLLGVGVILFACGGIVVAVSRQNAKVAKDAALNAEVARRVEENKANRPAPTPPEPKRAAIYTPRKDITCATDANFLDASPLTSPANFVRVHPGTKLAKVRSVLYARKPYFALSAGGRERIYVYANQFDELFEEVE